MAHIRWLDNLFFQFLPQFVFVFLKLQAYLQKSFSLSWRIVLLATNSVSFHLNLYSCSFLMHFTGYWICGGSFISFINSKCCTTSFCLNFQHCLVDLRGRKGKAESANQPCPWLCSAWFLNLVMSVHVGGAEWWLAPLCPASLSLVGKAQLVSLLKLSWGEISVLPAICLWCLKDGKPAPC